MTNLINLLKKKDTLVWIVLSAVSILLFRNFGLTNKQTICYIAVSLAAILIHLKNASENNTYIKNIFCINSNSSRVYELDHLRFLAVIFVIITHAVQVDNSKGLYTTDTDIFIHTCIYILALSCNLLYVMISGALLLQYKDEKLSDFYLRRLPKVILPMIIYYLWYLWQNNIIHEVSPLQIILRLYTGTTGESPHYWLLLVIISLYVVYPFIRYMLKDMPYSYITAIVIIGLLFMAFNALTPEPIYYSIFLADWIGVAIIGYWLTLQETRKYFVPIMILGLVSAVIICFIIRNVDDFLAMVTNCSPLMTLFSMGIVSAVFYFKNIFSKGNFLLRLISKYSYGIILIHWWCLHWITIGRFNISTTFCGYFGIIIAAIITLIAATIFAFFIDNYVMVVINYLVSIVLNIKKEK